MPKFDIYISAELVLSRRGIIYKTYVELEKECKNCYRAYGSNDSQKLITCERVIVNLIACLHSKYKVLKSVANTRGGGTGGGGACPPPNI